MQTRILYEQEYYKVRLLYEQKYYKIRIVYEQKYCKKEYCTNKFTPHNDDNNMEKTSKPQVS
uniref:Unkown protein n=1 Tax=Riptortus pedestris TaxID=329032 RepID=R4WE34_RIPPE|nr:unkown protein [Riptortus pedestris]